MPGLTFSFRRQRDGVRPDRAERDPPARSGSNREVPPSAASPILSAEPAVLDGPVPSVEDIQRATDAGQETVESHFWLTRRDQAVFAACCTILLVLFAIHWVRLTNWSANPVEIERLPSQANDFRFDVNEATWVEFRQLDGIGEALAHRIVEDRARNGPFQSIDELRRVRGIGPKTLERIRPWLTIRKGGRMKDESNQNGTKIAVLIPPFAFRLPPSGGGCP
jgi:competence protein ComEA